MDRGLEFRLRHSFRKPAFLEVDAGRLRFASLVADIDVDGIHTADGYRDELRVPTLACGYLRLVSHFGEDALSDWASAEVFVLG
jgi:hypothetical protein